MNLHNGFAVFFVLASVFCLVAGAAESVQQDPQFQALQAHLRECRTEADILERYKTPLWREEREGGIIECGWAWDGFLFLMGCHDGCTGFSAGISKETGEFLWWSPHWLGSVPRDAQSCYLPDGTPLSTDTPLEEGREEKGTDP